MSITTATPRFLGEVADTKQRHRLRMFLFSAAAILLIGALFLYGFDYYALDSLQRPYSAKHKLLRPSGAIGLRLGYFGFLLFMGLYLYPIRKRWPWLAKKGNSKHWLDVHVLLGVTAPCVIAFHSSFKFHGIAGVAFWIMTAVAVSGIVGRYLYAQIPRSLGAADLSLKEIQAQQNELMEQLKQQRIFSERQLSGMLQLPSSHQVQSMSVFSALVWMMWLDVLRKGEIARLRRHAIPVWQKIATLGGILSSSNQALEQTILLARRQAALTKRVLFLTKTQQVFHLWHVVHRPFSYSFAVLSSIHIVVAMLFSML